MIVTDVDKTLYDNTTLSQTLSNLLLKFSGAEIDFSTGSIFEDDGTTPLGQNFTPATITASEWQWYSVGMVLASVDTDNSALAQMIVLPASGSGASKAAAPKAVFSGTIRIGQVAVQDNGAGGSGTIEDIAQADIRQLGTGSGGGGGGGVGDISELELRLRIRIDDSPWEFGTRNVFAVDEEDRTDSATASFDFADLEYDFPSIGNNIVSTQSLDPVFLAPVGGQDDIRDVGQVELMCFWKEGAIDPIATYEVSRDGGNEYQAVTMTRVGSTDTFRGVHIFDEEAADQLLNEYNVSNADSSIELDTTSAQAVGAEIVIANATVVKNVKLYLNKAGSPLGNLRVQLVKDSSGLPSTSVEDIIGVSDLVDVSGLGSGNITVDFDMGAVPVVASTIHAVLVTDAAYKGSFVTATDVISIRTDASAPTDPVSGTFNGTTWSASAEAAVYQLEGRDLDLRVRITSGTTLVSLKGYGIFYGKAPGAITTGVQNLETVSFDGGTNPTDFTLSNFLPNPDLLRVYMRGTGQVFRFGDFALDGYTVKFPADTFDLPGETVVLVFDQVNGGAFDNSDVNLALLAANHLGAEDATIDKSLPGRGIILQRPDATKREVTIDNLDNIVIKTVP